MNLEEDSEDTAGNVKDRQMEVDIIDENLEVMTKFLDVLDGRNVKKLPEESIARIGLLKKRWDKLAIGKDHVETEIVVKSNREEIKSIVVDKSKGAISKVKKDFLKSEASSEASGSSKTSSENSSAIEKTKNRKRNERRKKRERRRKNETKYEYTTDSSTNSSMKSTRRKGKSADGMQQFMKAISRLDSRRVPSPEKFDEKSGERLEKYLDRFEQYCKSSFKGDSRLWIGELDKFISGKLRDAFRAMRDTDDTYDSMKIKIINWYDNMKESRKQRQRGIFGNLKLGKSESIYLFTSRLEKHFKLAYPKHNVKSSKILRNKLIEALTKGAKDSIKSQIMSYKLADIKISWNLLQKWAKCYDSEVGNETSEERRDRVMVDSEEEISISIGQQNRNINKRVNNVIDYSQGSDRSNSWGNRDRMQGNNSDTNYRQQTPNINYRQENFRNNGQGNTMNTNNVPRNTNFNMNYNRNFEQNRNYDYENDRNVNYNRDHDMNRNGYRQNSQHREMGMFQRPAPHLSNNIVRCNYCNRIGHNEDKCRSRLGLCFLCGAENHRLNQCPENRNRGNKQTQARNRRYSMVGNEQYNGNQQNNRNHMGNNIITNDQVGNRLRRNSEPALN
jgi:hypothetical protein